MNPTKITRQLATKSTSCPIEGARIGTSMNTDMTKDMMRAMAAPPCPSRTMAMETMRGLAAPKPCKARPASIISKLVENKHRAEPARKISRPAKMAGLRPVLSEMGP